MAEWRNFRMIKDWAVENAGATDCSRKCHSCEKTWAEINKEGRGDEYLHMIDLPKGEATPCGIPFKFLCNSCYLIEAIN